MEVFTLVSTDDTPEVILDKGKNTFKFAGKSLPEDVKTFYTPIHKWLEQYGADPNPETVFEFRMEYFNSSSSKQILDIMSELEKIVLNGHDVKVKWYFQEDDEDMEEAGESYGEIVEVPIEIISYE